MKMPTNIHRRLDYTNLNYITSKFNNFQSCKEKIINCMLKIYGEMTYIVFACISSYRILLLAKRLHLKIKMKYQKLSIIKCQISY